jgi:hypothetical protein
MSNCLGYKPFEDFFLKIEKREFLDPPRDNGGADIQQYNLELEESKGRKKETQLKK